MIQKRTATDQWKLNEWKYLDKLISENLIDELNFFILQYSFNTDTYMLKKRFAAVNNRQHCNECLFISIGKHLSVDNSQPLSECYRTKIDIIYQSKL